MSNYDLCIEELNDCISAKTTVEDDFAANELSSYIDEFLDTLSKTNRMIFIRRFWYMDSYGDISKASGINEGAIRTRLSRIKAELKDFLENKGVTV